MLLSIRDGAKRVSMKFPESPTKGVSKVLFCSRLKSFQQISLVLQLICEGFRNVSRGSKVTRSLRVSLRHFRCISENFRGFQGVLRAFQTAIGAFYSISGRFKEFSRSFEGVPGTF